MDFLRAIINKEEILTDDEVEKILDEIEQLGDLDQIDEDAWANIEQRVKKREAALYRWLVGTENMMLSMKFLELADKGRSIPAPIAKAYYPAIEILDDIVQAGPGSIQLLLALHRRAKRNSK